MNSLIKNKAHRRTLSGVMIIIGLTITVGLFSIARGGNFLLANIAIPSTDIESVSDKEAIVVQTKKLSPETILQNISTSAITKPFEEVDIFPEISGKVTNFYCSEGEYVKKGQIIASLVTDQSLLTNFENAKTNLEIAKENKKNTERLQKQLKKSPLNKKRAF